MFKHVFPFLLLSLLACGPKIVYDKKLVLEEKWAYDRPLTFNYEISDTTKAYNLLMTIDHDNNFSYENLYVNATTIFPDAHKLSTPFSLQLSNQNGDWIGKCSGDECQIEIEISSKAYYKLKGNYILTFEQYARKDSLEGIKAISIKIAEAE